VTPVHRPSRLADFFDSYTKDLTAEDLQRLFTRDTRDAYKFFTRGRDADAMQRLPWHRRIVAEIRMLFLAFSMKLSPARRVVFGGALVLAVVGMIGLFKGLGIIYLVRVPILGGIGTPGPLFQTGTWSLFFAFAAMNLLVLLEVADRLSLKNDLEIARDIQQAMLPSGLYTGAGVETVGMSRPANTVGGDFYDILPLDDGRLVITLGDVAGKGSPAALLMALLLAMLRTLVDEQLEPSPLITRLNKQVCRHAPGTRFITLFYGVFDPRTGLLTYVSAGHMPPLLLHGDGRCERLTEGGISLGMFEHSTYTTGQVVIATDDLFAVYSDGITEAESQAGVPFDEIGLETALKASRHNTLAEVGASVVRAVERHTDSRKFADDLTILLLRRCTTPAAAGV
jgi:sigma-B regulation protein RsbU (phosphoserine phosphatase)